MTCVRARDACAQRLCLGANRHAACFPLDWMAVRKTLKTSTIWMQGTQ